MIPLWAKVGTKVVCIDAIGIVAGTRLVKGAVYTIRDVYDGIVNGVVGNPSVHLEGIANPIGFRGIEWGYLIRRFAPLVSKTESEDLAVFRRIADLAGVDEALRRLEGVE